MKLVREKRGRPAVVGAATAAAADTVGAGKAAASEEATDQFANNGSGRVIWAGLDSNQRRRKASRFTVCPVWPLRYLPSFVRAIHIGSHVAACNWPQLRLWKAMRGRIAMQKRRGEIYVAFGWFATCEP